MFIKLIHDPNTILTTLDMVFVIWNPRSSCVSLPIFCIIAQNWIIICLDVAGRIMNMNGYKAVTNFIKDLVPSKPAPTPRSFVTSSSRR